MAETFRRFRVARKHPESSVITSFHLVPADGGALWPARPGQYLTLRIPGPEGPVLRTTGRLDNTGGKSIGRWRAALGLQHANLFGLDHIIKNNCEISGPEISF